MSAITPNYSPSILNPCYQNALILKTQKIKNNSVVLPECFLNSGIILQKHIPGYGTLRVCYNPKN